MAGVPKLSDDTLRACLAQNMTQAQIASACHVTESAISQRVKALEAKVRAKAPVHTEQAMSSMWDVRNAAQENYQRCLDLLEECESATERTRVIGEIRQHVAFGMQVLETLYAVNEVQSFMDEVLTVLDECDPAVREKILSRLREKRALRAAFLPS